MDDVASELQLPTLAVGQQVLQHSPPLFVTPLLILSHPNSKLVQGGGGGDSSHHSHSCSNSSSST